jgi:hypothetical protein
MFVASSPTSASTSTTPPSTASSSRQRWVGSRGLQRRLRISILTQGPRCARPPAAPRVLAALRAATPPTQKMIPEGGKTDPVHDQHHVLVGGRGRRPDIEGWLSAARRQGRCTSLRDGLRPPLTPTITEQIGLVIGPPPDPGRVTNRGTHAVELNRVSHNQPRADCRYDKERRSSACGLMRFQRVGGSIPSRRT